MRAGTAILATLGVLAIWILAAVAIHPALGWAVFLGSSIWAGVDAGKIQLKKYKVGGPSSPAITVIGCLLLWVVVFPWYLINKGKILRGEVSLKEEYAGQAEPRPASKSKSSALQADSVAQLEKLADLRERGVLSEEEFQAQKANLLS